MVEMSRSRTYRPSPQTASLHNGDLKPKPFPILGVVGLLLVAVSWSQAAGNPAHFKFWITLALGASSGLLLLRRDRWNIDFSTATAWCLLAAYVLIAAFHPQFSRVIDANGDWQLQRLAGNDFPLAAATQDAALRQGGWLVSVLAFGTCLYRAIRRRAELRAVAMLLGIHAVLLGLCGVYFLLQGEEGVLGRYSITSHSYFSAFRHDNHFVACAVLTVPLLLGLAQYYLRTATANPLARRQPVEYFLVLMAGLLLLAMVLSGSRSGVIYAVLLALTFPLPFLRLERGGASWRTSLLLLAVAGVILLAGAFASWDRLERKWDATLTEFSELSRNPTGENRYADSWSHAGKTFLERPLTGWGPGSHPVTYELFAEEELRDNDNYPAYNHPDAGNDWLQFLGEYGLIGCLLIAWPILTCLRRRLQSSLTIPALSWWGMGGLALVAFMGLYESPFHNPAALLHGTIVIVLVLRGWELSARRHSSESS